MDNREIASVLRELATYNDLIGANPFKARAFESAARTIEKLDERIEELAATDRLREVKGVGKSTETIVRELLDTGRATELEQMKARFPPGITDLLRIQGLGPKRIKVIYEKLGIASIGELEYACRENRLLGLEGFGAKTQANVLKAIEFLKTTASQRLYSEALAIGNDLVARSRRSRLFARADIAGSLRRGTAVFKDIDILLVPKDGVDSGKVQAFLLPLADEGGVIGAGDTKVSIRHVGLQVDFRIVPAASWPAGMQHFTGSKEHNTLLRARARSRGLKMNEYGVFDLHDRPLPIAEEADVYGTIALPWIPPEIREADGEIEAAERGQLPRLVEPGDLRGVIHAHTSWSDGVRSLEELARECIHRGYQWLCLSDHSRTAAYAGGLAVERLREQAQEVRRLNGLLAPFRIFHGIESDILPDGSLDYPDEVLAELDFVIGSVHAKLTMDREEATGRLLAAIANPRLTILGHPGGGLLLARAGYPYDEERVLAVLAEHGVALEHNSNPHRLDAPWELLKRAHARGIKVTISPDAHDLDGLDDIAFGVTMARKAWLGPTDILNCWSADEIEAHFAKRHGSG
jgi:DNA polymerase (family 10)